MMIAATSMQQHIAIPNIMSMRTAIIRAFQFTHIFSFMTATTAAPKFVPGPVLSHGSPRSPPPPKLPGYGDSCFRATCYLEVDTDDAVTRLASFVGYHNSLEIIGEVESTCQLHAKKHQRSQCSDPQLTFLASSNRECSGQVYFYYEH
jgi:hypothetical protein